MEFTVIFLALSFTWILSISSEDIPDLSVTNVCQNSGKQLYCQPGRVLHITDVRCLPNNYTCPEKQRILDLCDGQTSCSSIGLKNQVWNYCKGFTYKQVLVSYRCVRDVVPVPCRTNICSDESDGLFCSPGNIIHVFKAFCTNPFTECDWSILHTLYILCEGKAVCFASGLRLFMPNTTCLDALKRNANLIVDYVCIPESLSNDICTGEMITLSSMFGIIKSPGFPENPYGNSNGCFWAIVPGKSQLVELTVHVMFSRESGKYLQLKYTDCRTMKVKEENCCLTTTPNQVRQSCGAVYVRHRSYQPGDQHGNRFVISYQVKEYRSLLPSYAMYTSECSSSMTQNNKTMTGSYVIDDTTETGGKRNETDHAIMSSFDPDRFDSIFKIVVINFFLFLVAYWLVIGLCIVCCRYCKLRKTGEYKLAMQSDTDSGHSGRRTDPATSMQTFSEGIEESPDRETCFNHLEKRNTRMYTSISSDGPYASVHKSSYHPEQNISMDDNTTTTGNRTSSFRPPNIKNPYASYDSLDFDEPIEDKDSTPEDDMLASVLSKTTVEDFPPPPPPELLDSDPPPTPPPQNPSQENNLPIVNSDINNGAISGDPDVQHYTINDDDYAIVQKPKRKPQLMPKPNQAHNPMYGQVPHSAYVTQRSTSPNNNEVTFSENAHMYEPEESRQHARHQKGYLPHHHCMLECDGNHPHNFPPPAQLNRSRVNGHSHDVESSGSHVRNEHFY